jgi:hypothetical protein
MRVTGAMVIVSAMTSPCCRENRCFNNRKEKYRHQGTKSPRKSSNYGQTQPGVLVV